MNAAFKGPDPKHKPSGKKKYRRKVAGPKQWAALRAEKLEGESCRGGRFLTFAADELHHLVSRSAGGDDVADNLIPLCRTCHALVENRDETTLRLVAESLTNEEAAYCHQKLGVAWRERLFGAP